MIVKQSSMTKAPSTPEHSRTGFTFGTLTFVQFLTVDVMADRYICIKDLSDDGQWPVIL